jgi:hypothetical protein
VARALVGYEDPVRPVHYDHHHSDSAAYNDAATQYRAGYAETAIWPGDDGVLVAFAWSKLAQRLIHQHAPGRDIDYALAAGGRALSGA